MPTSCKKNTAHIVPDNNCETIDINVSNTSSSNSQAVSVDGHRESWVAPTVSLSPLPLTLPLMSLLLQTMLRWPSPPLLAMSLAYWHFFCLLRPQLVPTVLMISIFSSHMGQRLKGPLLSAILVSQFIFFCSLILLLH